MKMTGMQWQKYDMLIRQKRGKKISRRYKKVGSWTTDVILYLECQQSRPANKTQGAKLGSQRLSMGPPVNHTHPQRQVMAPQGTGEAKQPPSINGIQLLPRTCCNMPVAIHPWMLLLWSRTCHQRLSHGDGGQQPTPDDGRTVVPKQQWALTQH